MPNETEPTRRTEPTTVADQVANSMLERFEEAKGRHEAKAIVMVYMPGQKPNCSSALAGWADDAEAVAHMLMSLQAIMRANGKDLRVVTL